MKSATKLYNFSAGPAMLPPPVLDQIERELRNWHKGVSIMELGHRIPEIVAMAAGINQNLRDLLHVPPHFKILLMQGGARTQFSAVPLNLLFAHPENPTADYLVTGHWSSQAMLEAKKYGDINIALDKADEKFDLLDQSTWGLKKTARYVHFTDNETIDGIEFSVFPRTGSVPLVIDITSSILSKPIDFTNVGILYASAQKNLGIAGLTVVIVREDLIGNAHPLTPMMLDYGIMLETDSMVNTPPVFSWYVTSLVLQWAKSQGGITVFEGQVLEKSNLLYDMIDNSDFYTNKVNPRLRSRMNIPFSLPTADLDNQFLQEADAAGLLYLKGHRVVGGIRASFYNAMPIEGVKALVAFMKKFEQDNRL